MPAQCSGGGPLTEIPATKKIEPGGHLGWREDRTHGDIMSRSRSTSESSDNVEQLGLGGMCEVGEVRRGVSYDMDGKFSYSQVVKCGLIQKFKTTVDENGKFNYYSSDMRPVPPGKLLYSYSYTNNPLI